MQPMTKTQTDRSAQPPTLADYLAILRRRKWVIIVGARAGARNGLPDLGSPARALPGIGRRAAQPPEPRLAGHGDPGSDDLPGSRAFCADSGGHRALARGVGARGREGWARTRRCGGYSVSPKANADVLVFTVSAARPGEPPSASSTPTRRRSRSTAASWTPALSRSRWLSSASDSPICARRARRIPPSTRASSRTSNG